MSLRVDPAHSRGDFRTFLRLPWKIYRDDPAWIPPILRQVSSQFDRRRYPFFRHGEVEPFLAWRGSEPVGRIVAIQNKAHTSARKDGQGFFGFLEMEKDLDVTRALLREAGRWLRARGLERLLGPVQFTTNDTCGILVEGFDDPPAILMPHNPPYYGPLLEEAGLSSPRLLLAYLISHDTLLPEQMRRIAGRAEKKGVRVRLVDFGDFEAEIDRVREVYNSAWDENWGFQPMTKEEFYALAEELRRGADRRLLLVAEAEGRPVGCALSLPDLNPAIRLLNGRLTPWGLARLWLASKKVKRIRTLVLGVTPRYRRRGVDALLIRETVDRGLAAGYRSAELSWVLEDNRLMNRGILAVGGVVHKKYRLYEGELAGLTESPSP